MLGLALLAAGVVQAEGAAPPAEPRAPFNLGYAFDQPDILLRQRIFGLAHGVHLLLSGCLDKNENTEAAQQAYDTWHMTQRDVLERVRGTLADHHFGAEAGRMQWQDVARALGLKETIYPSLGTLTLQEACATLPQALAQPRYDFASQLESIGDTARR
jgi:hypothetical protein